MRVKQLSFSEPTAQALAQNDLIIVVKFLFRVVLLLYVYIYIYEWKKILNEI